MRPFIIYHHSLLLKNSPNSSHVNWKRARSTKSFLSCSPIHFLRLKPCGWNPFQVPESFSCNLPMVFLSKVLPPKRFPFNINYPLSQLTCSIQKGTEAWQDFFSLFFFFSFSLSTTCASLCIYGGASHHPEDITSCSVGTQANRYWMGGYCSVMCCNASHTTLVRRLVVLQV